MESSLSSFILQLSSLRIQAAQYYCHWGIGIECCCYMQSYDHEEAKKLVGAP